MRYFTATGWIAIFTGTDVEIGRTRPVEAWHQTTGEALVVDPQRGVLRPISERSDFSHLERAERVVGVVPGGGWRVHWNAEGETESVLAWLITENGSATPITVDAEGLVATAELADLVLPPDQELS